MKKKLEEIIRVDHAGEFGAKVIYDGQMVAMRLKGDLESLELIKHMKEQEDVHFDYFDAEMKRKKVRPTLMRPLWKIGGFALGFFTALADKKAAMTCTTAVEGVIDQHYQEQLVELEKFDEKEVGELKEKIKKFREEELEHRDIAYKNHAAELKGFTPLSAFIKGTTKFAIAVSKKL